MPPETAAAMVITMPPELWVAAITLLAGFIGWLTYMAHLLGAIRADMNRRLRHQEKITSDHELRIRTLEARPHGGG
jgi:hypothetical protein